MVMNCASCVTCELCIMSVCFVVMSSVYENIRDKMNKMYYNANELCLCYSLFKKGMAILLQSIAVIPLIMFSQN